MASQERDIKTKIKKIFEYYSDLNYDDINYITKIIYKAIDVYSKLIIANFLLYMNKTGICKFSITFSSKVIKLIKDRNTDEILKQITSDNTFEEIYNNNRLTHDEIEYLEVILAREYIAMIYYLYSDSNTSCYDCYNNICTMELIDKGEFNYRPLYKNQLVLFEEQKTYCYDIYELLTKIVKNQVKELSDKYINYIKIKYAIELKLIEYNIDEKEEDKEKRVNRCFE